MNAIKIQMSKKTVIIASSELKIANKMDYIIIMQKNQIIHQGTYN